MRYFPHAFAVILLLTLSVSFATAQEASVLGHTMKTLAGEDVNLERQYEGKVLLVVNVASRCGYTRQYEPLEALHQQYAGQGFAVIGVPCNQFGAQEPGSEEEIAEFCQTNYGVTFDMMAKVNVNAPDQCPLYADLTATEPAGPIGWNFEKFLINRKGQVVGRYKSSVEPDSVELISAIEREIALID